MATIKKPKAPKVPKKPTMKGPGYTKGKNMGMGGKKGKMC